MSSSYFCSPKLTMQDALGQRTQILEDSQTATKNAINKRRNVERLKGSSSINPSKVDDALHEMEDVSYQPLVVIYKLTNRQTHSRTNFPLGSMQYRRTYTYHFEVTLGKPMKMWLSLCSRTRGFQSATIVTCCVSWKLSDLTWPRSVPMSLFPLLPPQAQSPRRKARYRVSLHKWQVPGRTTLRPVTRPSYPIRADPCSYPPPLRPLLGQARQVHRL